MDTKNKMLDIGKKVLIVVLGIAFWYIAIPALVGFYLFKRNTTLTHNQKIALVAAVSVIFLSFGAALIFGSGEPARKVIAPIPKMPLSYAFDVPDFVGEEIEELDEELGEPYFAMEPTPELRATGVKMAEKTWVNDGRKLTATYDIETGLVSELFLSAGDFEGLTRNKDMLLRLGKLKQDASAYTVEFVQSPTDPTAFTGVRIKEKVGI